MKRLISCHCSWMLCHVAAVKSLHALIYRADYILLLVLWDHGIYSEGSKLIIFGIFRLISVFETTAMLKLQIYSIFHWPLCQVYMVTDKASIAETAVWPNFFIMNIFFALKGSKLFIIICCHCSWMLCRVAVVKSLPALIYSADYILLLVL